MWMHCTAHALDLALEDWGKLPLFKELCRGVRDIVKFVNGHQHSRAAFQTKSDLRLLTPGEFSCSFLACSQSTVHLGVDSSSARFGFSQACRGHALLHRVHRLHQSLKGQGTSSGDSGVSRLGAWADKHTYKAEAARVKRLILDDDMWAEIEVMEQLFKRVVQLLGLVDSNMPTLGKVSKCHADMLLQSMSRLMSALMAFLLCL